MLSVDKFPYPRKQTRGNEFIPCSNNIYDILNRFCSFKIPAITLIWPKSPYKHSVTRSYRSGKESGRRSESRLWRHQLRAFVFISHADDVKREIRLHISRLLTNQKRESARSMGYMTYWLTGWHDHCHSDAMARDSFPYYWPFIRENLRSPMESPHKWLVKRNCIWFFVFNLTNYWTSSPYVIDLIRHKFQLEFETIFKNVPAIRHHATVLGIFSWTKPSEFW